MCAGWYIDTMIQHKHKTCEISACSNHALISYKSCAWIRVSQSPVWWIGKVTIHSRTLWYITLYYLSPVTIHPILHSDWLTLGFILLHMYPADLWCRLVNKVFCGIGETRTHNLWSIAQHLSITLLGAGVRRWLVYLYLKYLVLAIWLPTLFTSC